MSLAGSGKMWSGQVGSGMGNVGVWEFGGEKKTWQRRLGNIARYSYRSERIDGMDYAG